MKKKMKLQDLDCANCAAKIETALLKMDGVTNAKVSFMTQKLEIEAPDDIFEQVLLNAKKVIKKVEPDVRIVES